MKDTVIKGDVQQTLTSIRRQDTRKQRKRFLAAFLVYTPLLVGSFWLFSSITSCGAPNTTLLPTAGSTSTPLQQELVALMDRAASNLQGNTPDRDYEVNYLNKRLNMHGVTVLRVNPSNPEHQRRYRRHLIGNLNPRMEMTPWQIQKDLVDPVPHLGL